ncbi:substrate-binding periplasmic protein [Arcobacter roscoffensis]|uniref:ABC transporter substrate-binding protein n=1 Tax=Arcobacter roscoffensis TaxID=2961520 RepID=A0ABY5E8D8_9BACT|nr:ABC transporter substrate-binding protein [Arcobacter roscoffensis]UTJ06983.1 ABC transporter substrate-binding protein [Arcobacter roscoffensis]
MNLLKSTVLIVLVSLFANARSIEHIQESGNIVLAVYENFPPYSYEENGELKGIDIELGKIIAKSLNVKPIWYVTGSDENLADDLRNTIWKGNLVHKTKADVMFRIPYDYDYLRMRDKSTGELENEMVTIKGPYQSEKWVIATHKDIIDEFETLATFAYHTIGVELDTLPDTHITGFARGLISKNVKHYFKFDKAINDFKNRKIDAIAGLKSQLEYLLDYKNNKDKYFISEALPNVKSHWDLATAVSSMYRPLSYHIDGVLHKAYVNGTIKKIFEKYGLEYMPPISKTQ